MKGESGIRLAVFLEDIGYQVVETETISGLMRDILWIIGYGIRSADRVTQDIGYTTPSNLFRILYGRDGVNNGPLYKLRVIVREDEYRLKAVQMARVDCVARLRLAVGMTEPYRPVAPQVQASASGPDDEFQPRPLGVDADPAVQALVDGITVLYGHLKTASSLPDLAVAAGNYVDPKVLMGLRNFFNAALEV